MTSLTLASGSPYRAQQLTSLGYEFARKPVNIDETLLTGEAAEAAVVRLTATKCSAGRAAAQPGEFVLAGDQLGECEGRILRKPGTAEAAVTQLLAMSGRTVRFYSGAAIGDTTHQVATCAVTELRVRDLSRSFCEHYVAADQPLDCAGAFKIESRGLLLFERVSAEDPTALVGLPMLWVCGALSRLGIEPQLNR